MQVIHGLQVYFHDIGSPQFNSSDFSTHQNFSKFSGISLKIKLKIPFMSCLALIFDLNAMLFEVDQLAAIS